MGTASRSHRAPAQSTLVLAMVLTVGCQEHHLPHFGTLRYESESFEVWASEGLEACAGTFEYTEQWLAAFRDRVGDHGNPAPHTFYWLSPEDFATDPCTRGFACARPYSNVIYSTVIPAEHEVVHVELDAQPPSVLLEGAAEVFGSFEPPYTIEVTDLDPLLDDEQIPGTAYPTAGRFSRFILDHHGLDAYFELYEVLDGSQGRDAFAAGVQDTLGLDLPALVADFERFSPCSVDRWRFFDLECSMLPLTPWQNPTRWSAELNLSCDASDVIGPRFDLIWTRRAFEVEQAGAYQLIIESADPTAQVVVVSCDGGCFDETMSSPTFSASIATGGTATVLLEAGRHWLQVEHAATSDAPVTVTIEQ